MLEIRRGILQSDLGSSENSYLVFQFPEPRL